MLRLTSHDGQSPAQNQPEGKSKPGLTIWELLIAWRSILRGYAPMLSIEITRECPLSCPGCYVDGLPEHHDLRRKPATYERILRNIEGLSVNIHWTITRPMLCRPSYAEEYVSFWSARPEVNRIWVSIYTPQVGEDSAEMLTFGQRKALARDLPPLRQRYPKLLTNEGIAEAFLEPPRRPEECLFSKMSVNYSADLKTRVEPCIFGGTPNCSQCGCAISSGLHWVKDVRVAGAL